MARSAIRSTLDFRLDPHLLQRPADPQWAPCYLQACRDGTIAPLSATTLVLKPLLKWADTKGVSYLAWSWFTGNCAAEPALILAYDGTPTGEGAGYRTYLLSLP